MLSGAAISSDPTLHLGEIREHYDRISPLYRILWGEHIHHGYWLADEKPAVAQENLVRELARRAGIKGGETVLDVGCGLGGSSRWLAREKGCRVKGISLSPRQVEAARHLARRQGLQALTSFAVQDAHELAADEPAAAYEVIWVVECSEHLFDKAAFFAACAAALRPGGRIAVCAWLAGGQSHPAARSLVQDVLRGMLCPSFGTLQDYEDWMAAAGLNVLNAEDITGRVARTWSLCQPLLNHPWSQALLRAGSPRIREFADSFQALDEAYRTGAMAYGMIVAEKPK